MADIPSDVIYLSILPRLPVKSLLRFKSVSKSWHTWISSPDFTRLQSHHARSSDKNRFLVTFNEPSSTLHLHELALPCSPPLLLPYPKTASMCKTSITVDIVASSEFVLLLKCSHDTDDLILLNPSTGSYHEIPHPSIQNAINDNHSIYGLYHDVANDNYKVAVISQISVSSLTKWEVTVYSYKTNSWTLIEQKLDTFSCIKAKVAVIGHLLHTMFYSNNTTRIGCFDMMFYSNNTTRIGCFDMMFYSNNTTRIVCFDIVAEQWTNDVPLPNNFEGNNLRLYRLCVKESWVNLMNINRGLGYYYLPLTYSEESRHKILFQTRNNKLFLCDIRNDKAEKIAFDGCKACLSGHTLCKESLVSFAGGRQINLRHSSKKY